MKYSIKFYTGGVLLSCSPSLVWKFKYQIIQTIFCLLFEAFVPDGLILQHKE